MDKRESATTLDEAQADTYRAHAELEEQLRQQTVELSHANRLLNTIIDTMPVGAIIADAEGLLLHTNSAGQEILGGQVSGPIDDSRGPYHLYYPDGTPLPIQNLPLWQALEEGRQIRNIELQIRRPDGEERSILASAAPIRDDRRNVVSAITVFQDITEREQSRMALNQAVERLTVLRTAAHVILTAGSLEKLADSVLPFTRELVECQLASALVFDWEMDEAIVLSIYREYKLPLEKETRIPLGKGWPLDQLAQHKISTIEDVSVLGLSPSTNGILQEGGVRSLVNVPLVAQDKLMGVLVLGFRSPVSLGAETTDILRQIAGELAIGIRQFQQNQELQRYAKQLERKVARRTGALRESEERYRTILGAAAFGIALIDTEGHIVQSNPALQSMLGYSEAELKTMNFSDYSHPDDAEADRELYQALASRDTGHYQVERRYVRKDGQVRWSELTVSRVKRSESGYPWLAVAVMEDVTEKKKIQESLFRADRQDIVSRLGTSLAHEINNPLQSVIGCLGLAEEMLEEGSEVRRFLDIAMEELVRASGIVSQLRDIGLETEMKEKELIDLNVMVENVVLLTRKRCENQSLEVEWSPAQDLPPVALVPESMQQVLLNLVLNALEATDEGGRLGLRTAPTSQPAGVLVSISDTGKGIEADKLERIFEPFYSSRPDGLGLGLYISKKIVEEHHGIIEVDSRPGDGTTFTVWLPRE